MVGKKGSCGDRLLVLMAESGPALHYSGIAITMVASVSWQQGRNGKDQVILLKVGSK